MFGSGLVTLSRYPIVRHQFWRYAAGGFATAISCGDYYAGKGAGCTSGLITYKVHALL
jgi:sphingomyelin phosphodiesterase 2